MTPQEIDRFFRVLAKEVKTPVNVIVTGAAAGALWGCVRPSKDIDFAIEVRNGGAHAWNGVEKAVRRTIVVTGIPANYAQDIDRWGQISLLDYRRHTLRYKTFGMVDVRILDPAYWAIGKLTRYLEPDVQDLIAAFSAKGIPAGRLVRVWGTAVKKSPPSTARLPFRQHVEHFIRRHGRKMWGRQFDPEPALREFYRAAGAVPET